MIFQAPLNQLYNAVLNCGIPLVPDLVRVFFGALDKGVRSAGGCTTAMTMVLIVESSLRSLWAISMLK